MTEVDDISAPPPETLQIRAIRSGLNIYGLVTPGVAIDDT
jgi:hypothetical protein